LAKKKSNIISENSDKPAVSKDKHYVSNKDMYEAFVVWHQARKLAAAEGREEPAIPENIGGYLVNIANGFVSKYNWQSNTKWKEEMVGDAILNCIMYVRNFDPEKSTNPFSYFTQTCYYAFLRRIEKEKAQDYVKHKSMLNSVLYNELQVNGLNEDDENLIEGFEYDNSGVDAFIEEFELKNFGKTLQTNVVAGVGGKTKILEAPEEVGFL
jgi:hypothetical protein